MDDIDRTQWPFNLVARSAEDYDFDSYKENIPQAAIDEKFPSEAALNKFIAKLSRDKFFQTVKGQLR